MRFLLSLLLLYPSVAPASPAKSDDDSCAKIGLAAIYCAEKSYYSEYANYSDTDNDIGYSPEPGRCSDWEHSIRVSGDAQEFQAEFRHRKTGATWTIDQTKKW